MGDPVTDYLLILGGCIVVPMLVVRVPRAIDWVEERINRRRARFRPSGPPVERLASDLRRLSKEIERLETLDEPGRMLKLRATVAAYDDTLLLSCRTLGVPPPRDRAPLDARERLDAEVMLLQQGFTW